MYSRYNKTIEELVGFDRACAPVFLGSLPHPTGRCAPPANHSCAAPPKQKINYFQKQNVFLQAQTRVARNIYFFTGLSCTLLSYAAPY